MQIAEIVISLPHRPHLTLLSLISQPGQPSLAGIVRPTKLHIVHEEHPRLVANECLHPHSTQAPKGGREADMLQLAIRRARTWRQGRILRVGGYLVLGIGTPGVASEDYSTQPWTSVIAAHERTEGVEPESRHRLVRAIADLTRLHGAGRHTAAVGEEDCKMRRR